MAAQIVEQLKCHHFFIKRVAPHCAAGGQIIAAFFNNDFRPQHAGGVVKPKVVGEKQALLGFGDAGLVAGFGAFFAEHAVNQSGFAHVGNAANQHAQGLFNAFAVRHKLAAGCYHFGGGTAVGRIERNGVGVGAALEFGQPDIGALGVGQILLV